MTGKEHGGNFSLRVLTVLQTEQERMRNNSI